MSSRWLEAYNRLTDFIKANPSIVLNDVVLAIPSEIRPEFYRLFDEVNSTFVLEMFPGEIKDAEELGENFRRARDEVKDILNLENISTLGFLERYLDEPVKELARELFEPMFDILKNRVTPEAFERNGIKKIQPVIVNSQRLGYAKWVALTFVKQISPTRVFSVAPPESKLDGHGEPLCFEVPVSYPEETNTLDFTMGPDNFPPFITPNFILHSAKLNKYVSFRSEMIRAEYISLNASERREWYRISSMLKEYKASWRNPSLLIFVSEDIADLALIADKDRMCRPDMIIDIREPGDWDGENDTPASAKLYDILDPPLGRFIISRTPLPQKPVEDVGQQGQEANVKIAGETSVDNDTPMMISVGFDESKLQPAFSKLVGDPETDKIQGERAV